MRFLIGLFLSISFRRFLAHETDVYKTSQTSEITDFKRDVNAERNVSSKDAICIGLVHYPVDSFPFVQDLDYLILEADIDDPCSFAGVLCMTHLTSAEHPKETTMLHNSNIIFLDSLTKHEHYVFALHSRVPYCRVLSPPIHLSVLKERCFHLSIQEPSNKRFPLTIANGTINFSLKLVFDPNDFQSLCSRSEWNRFNWVCWIFRLIFALSVSTFFVGML